MLANPLQHPTPIPFLYGPVIQTTLGKGKETFQTFWIKQILAKLKNTVHYIFHPLPWMN